MTHEIDAHIYKHEDGSLRLKAIVHMDCPKRFLSVGVAAEAAWELLKEIKQKLQAPPEVTTFVKVSLSPEVEEMVAARDAALSEEKREKEPRRDVAGNVCCADCGLATALQDVDGRYLCDLCAEKKR